MRNTFLFFAIILIGLTGCKKGKADLTITGVLSDSTFGQTLSNISVSLYEIEAGSTNGVLIGQTSTTSSGSYSFTFPRNQVESYTLIAQKDNYFDIEETIYFGDLTIEEDNVYNFSTTAKAWVKLHFVNTAPSAPTDLLRYIKQQGKSGCSECHTDAEQFISGEVDTVIYCANDGNTLFSYFYEVIGGSNFGIKSANTVAFDTTEILLNY